MKKRLFSLFLALALLLTVLLPAIPAANAAKQEKTRAIGIVFDNSGSMFVDMGDGQDNRMAWCRATYAAEAFASMMNEGDQLILYPMNPFVLGKNGTQEYSRENPLVIQGPEQSETIRQIYTTWAGDTPFKTVTAAYEGLAKVKADEKYLIILTDGKFEEDDVVEEMDTVNSTLDQYSQDVQVMYLGLGVQKKYTPTESNTRQHYVKANNTSAVLTELTDMCNRIFGRDLLPLSGNTASFDVSMSKLIVFIQGENISDVTLGGRKPNSQHATKYSELGCKEPAHYDWKVDYSLQGVIATFEDLDAGRYELSYSGNATSTSIYYEPDVDLAVELIDAYGNPIGKEVCAGTYTLNYSLVDKHGNSTVSDRLGDVSYSVELNGESISLDDPSHPGSIELELNAGDKLHGLFSVRYLKDYTIEKDSSALGWGEQGLEVITRPVGQVTAKVTGGADVYPLSQLEELAVYEVSIFCEGEQITGADLDRTELKVDLDGGNAVPDIQKTENGYTVTLKYNGSAADTQCGAQSVSFNAAYTNEDGQTGNADPIIREFEIQDDSTSLKADIQLEQNYYVISKLDEAAPIRFRLTADGAPLSEEAFAATQFSVDMEGLVFDLQADPQSSSYTAALQPGQKITDGKYTVSCVANGFDEIGRPVTAEDSVKIECRSYPSWIPWLISLLILIGLLTILWIIMNTKILPKKILLNDDVVFTVRGREIPGAATCSYAGGNKKKGSLRIQSPPYIPNPMAQCGLALTLTAISPRRTKSRSRHAQVTRVTALNPGNTTSISIGGFQMEKDPATGTLVPVGGEENANINFKIGNNTDFEVVAKVPDGTGRRITCTLSGTLRFL